MNLCVIGTGYVGLVTGACFAEMGNRVVCVDKDESKILALQAGQIPIYEPGLENIVTTNVRDGRLHFTTSLAEAMRESTVYFIAVGTPPQEDGSADLQHVLAVAREIGRHMDRYCLIVDKSTVPVGTADSVRAAIQNELVSRKTDIEFDVVSNPEFLKEGDAVKDFTRPDRVVVGVDSERAAEMMRSLYYPFMRNHERILFMGVRDAEMTKYAANAMLATKISFMNEIAHLCERLGVDVENVRLGIGSDSRIGYSFIYPGAGYGGSCFPKDVKALIHTAEASGFDAKVLQAVEQRNEVQKRRLFEKVAARFTEDLRGVTLGLWGLSFKPGTDDLREAPSVVFLRAAIAAGARIQAYDPVAMEAARHTLPGDWYTDRLLTFTDNQYDAIKGVDALVLVTEWKPFRYPDFAAMRRFMKQPIIFDGRNLYDPKQMLQEGFEYFAIGRGLSAAPAVSA
jgi:UDPglucose 6-dehydrogenase